MISPLNLEPGGADLGKWGRLQIVDREHLAVVKEGRREDFEVPIDWQGPVALGLQGWVFEETGIALVLSGESERVLAVDLLVPEVKGQVPIERDPDRRFRVLRLTSFGSWALLLWERGLACFESDGSCRWIAMHEDSAAGFDAVTTEEVWIKGQSGDAARDRRRGYRLGDGAPLDPLG
jgi:hypothetical protein